MNKKLKRVLKIVGGVTLVGVTLIGMSGCTNTDTLNKMNTNLDNINNAVTAQQERINALENPVVDTDIVEEAIVAECTTLATPEGFVDATLEGLSESDDYFYGDTVSMTADNTDVKKLFTDEVEFKDVDYDIEETITVDGTLVTSADIMKLNSDVALKLEKGAIVYKQELMDLNYTYIDSDDDLELTFLGQKLRVVNAKSDSITFETSKTQILEKDTCYNFDGKELTVNAINDAGAISVTVDGVTDTLTGTKTVNGLEISIKEAFADDGEVVVALGEDIRSTVEDGDAFELIEKFDSTSDAPWKWSIKENVEGNLEIGIESNERYQYADKDDEKEPLAVGEEVTLPFGYMTVSITDVSTDELYNYEFSIVDNKLLIESSEDGIVIDDKKYDEVQMNATAFYDMDNVFLIGNATLGKSAWTLTPGLTLDLNDYSFTFNLTTEEFTALTYAGLVDTDVTDRDEDIVDYEAIKLLSPEGNYNEGTGTIEIVVPKERPEVEVIIKG